MLSSFYWHAHYSGETRSQFPGNPSEEQEELPPVANNNVGDFFYTCYKMKSDQVFVLLHASVLKLGSEVSFISALIFFCYKKHKNIVHHFISHNAGYRYVRMRVQNW